MTSVYRSNSTTLLLGAETQRITVPVARSLHRRGIRVIVATLSRADRNVRSRAVARFVKMPDYRGADKGAWIAALLDIVADEGVDTIVPLTDAALALVSEHHVELRGAAIVACPGPDVVRRVLDKRITLSLAVQAGVPIPPTTVAPDLEAVRALSRTARFPIVAKPMIKTFERRAVEFKTAYYYSPNELIAACEADPTIAPNVIFQEYVPGDGLGFSALLVNGRMSTPFQHRHLTELPASGGVGVLIETEPLDPKVTAAASALLAAIEWDGPCEVEFRHEKSTGKFWLLEVNGRYWGSMSSALAAGIDLPYYHWQYLHGEVPALPASYPVGLRCRWAAGDFLRLRGIIDGSGLHGPGRYSIAREATKFLANFRPGVHNALWRVDDPQPALREAAGIFRGTAKRIATGRRPRLNV